MPAPIRITSFAGEQPRLIPRLLGDNYAQIARDTMLKDGSITPLRVNSEAHDFGVVQKTIFLDESGTWQGWQDIVNVVPGPVAADRLYVTGDGVPKVIADGVTYPLALASPTTAPTTSYSGTPDENTQYTVLYAYTWVTSLDEESAPSPLSSDLVVDPESTVEVSGFSAPPAGRAVNRMRLYRSETGTSGSTDLYFIKELPSDTTSFTDVIPDNPIAEAIPSTNYDPPPDALTGLVAMPNGMMAAFVGKDLYFSEPYIPHAWPEIYILTTDYQIVGLGVFGSSLAVLTTGKPYVCQGTSPASMVMERLDVNLPCVNTRSIVDLGYTLAYASNEGVVTVSDSGAALATRALMTRDQWLTMRPDSMICAQYDGRYIAAFNYYDNDGDQQTGSVTIDFSGEQPFLVRSGDQFDAVHYDIASGALYYLRETKVFRFDDPSQDYKTMLWRSKRFVMPGPANYGAIKIETSDAIASVPASALLPIASVSAATLAGTGTETTTTADIPSTTTTGSTSSGNVTVRVYADSVLRDTITATDTPVRLHGGYRGSIYEIEIEGTRPVTAISLASSPAEIAGLA